MSEDDEVMAGVRAATPAQWEALWAAVDRLLEEPWSVTWVSPEVRPDGVIVMGWPEYPQAMITTLAALSQVGAVTPAFDWPAWLRSRPDPKGEGLRTGPAADAVRFITSVVRSERFCDGSLDGAMRDGSLPDALARLRRWYRDERGPAQ